jgi:hypothetical protein
VHLDLKNIELTEASLLQDYNVISLHSTAVYMYVMEHADDLTIKKICMYIRMM